MHLYQIVQVIKPVNQLQKAIDNIISFICHFLNWKSYRRNISIYFELFGIQGGGAEKEEKVSSNELLESVVIFIQRTKTIEISRTISKKKIQISGKESKIEISREISK
jgi:hypothetical protein